MVRQSNVENQIDIVTILIEGSYSLPLFLLIQGGKTSISGTLSGLKMFEKILRSDQVNTSNNITINPDEPHAITGPQFYSESKPIR